MVFFGVPSSWDVQIVQHYLEPASDIFRGGLQIMLQLGFAVHQLEVVLSHKPYPDQTYASSWSRHQLTTVAGPMLTDDEK